MVYRKVTVEVVVNEDDLEVLERALNDAMDKVGDQVTVFDSRISNDEAGKPENAEQMAASAD